jgi:hypothetical protein
MMKAIGSPILGDERYGGTPSDRGYLHAQVLEFEWKGEVICCDQQPTTGEYFVGAIHELPLQGAASGAPCILNSAVVSCHCTGVERA